MTKITKTILKTAIYYLIVYKYPIVGVIYKGYSLLY